MILAVTRALKAIIVNSSTKNRNNHGNGGSNSNKNSSTSQLSHGPLAVRQFVFAIRASFVRCGTVAESLHKLQSSFSPWRFPTSGSVRALLFLTCSGAESLPCAVD